MRSVHRCPLIRRSSSLPISATQSNKLLAELVPPRLKVKQNHCDVGRADSAYALGLAYAARRDAAEFFAGLVAELLDGCEIKILRNVPRLHFSEALHLTLL